MSEWEKNLLDIAPYVAGEQPDNDKIIKLNANENPYPPSPMVEKALAELDAKELKKYPDANGTPLVKLLAEKHGIGTENVFVGNGSDDVLALSFRAFFNSDKPILYPDITYSFYPVWCDLLKIPYKLCPVDENFKIDPKDYYAENGGVVIANPNAPTSICEGKEFILDILEHNKDCVVIVDEAYVDFGTYSAVELISKYENLLVTQTFSKSRSLAGMRVGMAFGSEKLISCLKAVKDSYNSYPLDTAAQTAACAAIEDEVYFMRTVMRVKQTRDDTAQSLRELGFKVLESGTNFLFASHPDFSAEQIFSYLRENGIFVRYFKKPRIDNFLRITVGTDEQMKLMCELLTKLIIK
ncbi:MAG: histidinol-phosphate transaminase [Ruminococcus sp.]|nr:histidinol-phosphate transaminase [Ruminococcus sp.]